MMQPYKECHMKKNTSVLLFAAMTFLFACNSDKKETAHSTSKSTIAVKGFGVWNGFVA